MTAGPRRRISGLATGMPARLSSGAHPDARILLPAAAAWVAAWCALASPPPISAVAAAVGALLAAVALRRGRYVLAAVLVCATGACAAAGLRLAAVGTGSLAELAERGATVELELVVLTDPETRTARAGRPAWADDDVILRARAEAVTARGERLDVRSPILVRGNGSWLGLVPSTQVVSTGTLVRSQPGEPVAAAFAARDPPTIVKPASRIQLVAERLRAGLRDSVSGLPQAERGLVPGLVVGDESAMPEALEDDFRAAGLTHLTAVSGMNVAIVLAVVLGLARWLGLGLRAAPAVAALAMIGFVILARPQPSVLRASVMGLIAVAALAGGRSRRGLPALGAAVLVLVLLDPWLARSYGFALSVLATAGLLVLAPGWRDAMVRRRLPRPIAEALSVPLAAQVVCAPVVVMLSGQVSLVAVPANLLVAPAVPPATVLGVLAAVTAPLSAPVAELLAWLAGRPAWWIVEVAQHAAGVPGAGIGWPAGALGAVSLAAVVIVVVGLLRWLLRSVGLLIAGAAVAVVIAVTRLLTPGWPPDGWVVVACDVGQGDALALNVSPGVAIVVDAGPDPRAVDRCLRDLGVTAVPLVLLTHFHADHVNGLPGVLRRRQVGEVAVGPLPRPAERAAQVAEWVGDAGVPLTGAALGERRQTGAIRWRVLGPRLVLRSGDDAANDASVVVAADVAGVRLLLTGDVEPEAQRQLLRNPDALAADVFKVPHHGSRDQLPALATAVAPRVALVSVGANNDYGHPAPSTLSTLTGLGAVVARTDTDGDIAVVGPADRLTVVRRGAADSRIGAG